MTAQQRSAPFESVNDERVRRLRIYIARAGINPHRLAVDHVRLGLADSKYTLMKRLKKPQLLRIDDIAYLAVVLGLSPAEVHGLLLTDPSERTCVCSEDMHGASPGASDSKSLT